MPSLTDLRTNAEQSVNDTSNLEQSVPGLMAGLKQNLTSIFAKDNPLIGKREELLSNYLATPSQTSASLLPSNLPVVAGSNLNLSPTQQNAISEARSAAAFAPLASLNNLIVGQYGNVGNILQNTGDVYKSQIEAARNKQAGALDLFKEAAAQDYRDRALASLEAYRNRSLNIQSARVGRVNTTELLKRADAATSIGDSLRDIEDFRQAIKSGGFGIGASNPGGLRTKLPPTIFGLPNPLALSKPQADLRSKAAQLNTGIFAVAGKAFTGTERKLLEGLVVDPTTNETTLNATLDRAEKTLKNKLNQIKTGSAILPEYQSDFINSVSGNAGIQGPSLPQDDFQPD